jgi:signal peptidase I
MSPAANFSDFLKATLAKGNLCRFVATGFSMSPFIKSQDVLIIAPISRHEPRFGDVVAFINPVNGKLYVHRVIGMGQRSFYIKGDNLFFIDGSIPRENVIGVVVSVERKRARFASGLGYERIVIAFLSRIRIFPLILYPLRRLAALIRKGS